MTNIKKAAVGMSGGVDSSVAAYLVVKNGYKTSGITLKLTCDIFINGSFLEESSCCSNDDIIKARENCDMFKIEHKVLNLSEAFKEKIVNPFADEYFKGNTPNPCILCNRDIKWTELLKYLDKEGNHYFATGHYARVQFNEDTGRYELLKGLDESKDQSYVLWTLNQEQLSRTLLPLGEYTKETVRKMANELGLSNANKPDSQDICFVPNNDYRDFLNQYAQSRTKEIGPGNYIDTQGNIVGQHRGYYHYTIGQRRGLRLAMGYPVFVKKIIPEKNEVMIASKDEIGNAACTVTNLNWISIPSLESEKDITIKIRYKHKGVKAVLIPFTKTKIIVKFIGLTDSVTPGQSAVFYDGDRVVGGGIIDKSYDSYEEIEHD